MTTITATEVTEIRSPSTYKVTIPAGTYWVGDPCYAVPDGLWLPWLQQARLSGGGDEGILSASIDGMFVAGASTMHGDGVYADRSGREYCVDAGMIGVVDARLHAETEPPSGMHRVTFDADCMLVQHRDGRIQIGTFATIATDG